MGVPGGKAEDMQGEGQYWDPEGRPVHRSSRCSL